MTVRFCIRALTENCTNLTNAWHGAGRCLRGSHVAAPCSSGNARRRHMGGVDRGYLRTSTYNCTVARTAVIWDCVPSQKQDGSRVVVGLRHIVIKVVISSLRHFIIVVFTFAIAVSNVTSSGFSSSFFLLMLMAVLSIPS